VYARTPLINLYLFEGDKEPDNIRLMRLTDPFTTSHHGGSATSIIVILLCILVVLGGLTLGYFLKKSKKEVLTT